MNEASKLAEQHVREWDANLRRIDDLLARARAAREAAPEGAHDIDAQMGQIREDRERIVGVINDLRRQPFDAWPDEVLHEPGLKGTLRTIGDQLEQLITAIFARP